MRSCSLVLVSCRHMQKTCESGTLSDCMLAEEQGGSRRWEAVGQNLLTCCCYSMYLVGTLDPFCMVHGSLTFGCERCQTPAMAAGLPDHWQWKRRILPLLSSLHCLVLGG